MHKLLNIIFLVFTFHYTCLEQNHIKAEGSANSYTDLLKLPAKNGNEVTFTNACFLLNNWKGRKILSK